MSAVIGIDLGTTNSVVATLQDGRPRPVLVEGSPIVPSVVLYQQDGTILTGRQARNLALQHPDRVVSSIKRRMGRASTVDVGGRAIRPEEVSAEILRTLKQAAEAELGQAVDRAVITVPAYFDDAQRRATLVAGELAGITVLRLLNEPTAASLVYERSTEATAPELMLVYDLGGGTFDVSVLEVLGDVREVRASTGNSALGGDDFDAELVHRFVREIRTKHRIDVSTDAVAMARLRRTAEQTKIALSTGIDVEVREEFLAQADGTPVHLQSTVTRREFERLVEGLLGSTIELSRRALQDANLGPDEHLSRICMVGGSTRIPRVRELLAAGFDAEIHEEIDPDLAVGLGAAMQSGLLQGLPVQRLLVDVAAHSLGVRTADQVDGRGEANHFAPILRRNTALPAERTQELYTMMDDQQLVQVEVLQGESPQANRNTLVGEFEFPLRPVPEGSPVRVHFAYDLDGVVRVTASQPGGEEKMVQLQVADAGVERPSPVASTAIGRRARALLDSLPPVDRATLQQWLSAYENAVDEDERAEAEDELLDLFLDYEGR